MNPLPVVFLYMGTDAPGVVGEHLAEFLSGMFPSLTIEIRPDLPSWSLDEDGDEAAIDSVSSRLARAKVLDAARKLTERKPLPAEISFESRFLLRGQAKPAGILYDGIAMAGIYGGLLRPDEVGPGFCHIVVTGQFIGSWDTDDLRYHARASINAYPTIISTGGLVEAPAKPRDVYLARMAGARQEEETAVDKRYLTRDDPRISEALTGYILQALFYHITGDPFCDDRDCRLYNAHWQEELLHAQTRPRAGLCARHRKISEEWS